MTKEKSLLRKVNRSFRLPGERSFNATTHSFSTIEHILFWLLAIALVGSAGMMLYKINEAYLVEVPVYEGTLTEGITGIPRSINPLVALSEADRDLAALVYSGLLQPRPNNKYVPDLAESYIVSSDGLVYTFVLRDDVYWHDGIPVTSDDVIFTITTAQNPDIKSPLLANFDNIQVQKEDEKTISFILDEPYSPFLENATVGILPKHLWSGDEANFMLNTRNQEPIGSGPYKVSNVKRDSEGIPIYYELEAFEGYALGKPYIETIRLYFYANEEDRIEAFAKHKFQNMAHVAPEDMDILANNHQVHEIILPRTFGAFLNQNESKIFTDTAARKALDRSVDRVALVNEVLRGYATPLDRPIPPGSLGYIPFEDRYKADASTTSPSRIEVARELLLENGWKPNEETNILEKKIDGSIAPLSFTISTPDVPELKQVAEILKRTWEELGGEVEVKVYEEGNITHHVIRPRDYQVLIFGEVIGRHSDPYGFWHSSQRLDPGPNIALYTNIAVDRALERARATTSVAARIEQYEVFQNEVREDVPAVFLYAPEFIYLTAPEIMNVDTSSASNPEERFIGIQHWYTKTEKIWTFFNNTSK